MRGEKPDSPASQPILLFIHNLYIRFGKAKKKKKRGRKKHGVSRQPVKEGDLPGERGKDDRTISPVGCLCFTSNSKRRKKKGKEEGNGGQPIRPRGEDATMRKKKKVVRLLGLPLTPSMLRKRNREKKSEHGGPTKEKKRKATTRRQCVSPRKRKKKRPSLKRPTERSESGRGKKGTV